MKKAEKILIVLSIIALALNILLIPGGGFLTVLALSTLSMIYFYLGIALFNEIAFSEIFKRDSYKGISTLRILGAIGAGLAISIVLIGIMFKFQSWPGANINLGVGLIILLIVTIVALIKYSKNKSDYYRRIFKRVAIFGGLGTILMLIPISTWIEIKYRNHPAYIDALKKSMADPHNKELREKKEAEWDKLYYDREREK